MFGDVVGVGVFLILFLVVFELASSQHPPFTDDDGIRHDCFGFLKTCNRGSRVKSDSGYGKLYGKFFPDEPGLG